jgi:membrane associated rhomboid family serine protease
VLSQHKWTAFGLTGVFALIELAFQASDAGLFEPGLRTSTYKEFGFIQPWFSAMLAGLPAPPQTAWNMLTYAFLHGSMTHLLMNSGAFLGLGLVTLRIFGVPLFFLFFAVTAVGGSITFGLLASTPPDVPMVGVSGVVFGLIGVLKYAELAFIRRKGGSMRRYLSSLAALAAVNVVISVALSGLLAWETHLGGFVAGWLAAWWVVPKAQHA